ncbi:16S rRNA (adenine(1518)-N(6)/adenine(1519)-N(6))-dimethyltransferase RsmA [Spiroplasma tabanidicola]|uniref:Ribosomal RNA small subunit methyltransferase A n=1 Tax=Spiroplasma tabanidicola TaxID=324079 RepID=A0A6I6CE95_9MOLU|nr:16S rRNA (adenine(1518)-N(6)/adenine(1519)-N(6))-dimethyltransferase RsmA [Spiroplasma tabanidicola]QGS52452.1 16S rRNA (adenine1518-N6/adenine1519-N6)-dimethyltransferase [Spiroplasma tabanidicola]
MEPAKKKFGQNFITDKNLIKKIINILDQEPDHLIIEIGPGRGALTLELCNRFKKVVAIEIDSDMEMILKSNIPNNNLDLIINDVLKINFENLIKDKYNRISIISNTPYYITSEIIFKTLKISQKINKAVFMVQKEVAERICAKANEKNYNNLSVACQFYSNLKYEFTVKKNLFTPIPKVDSAIISMSFIQDNIGKVNDDIKFVSFVRKLFNNKRKTILNNLTNITNNKQKSLKVLDEIKIDSNKRPENISLNEFINLFNEVQNEKN